LIKNIFQIEKNIYYLYIMDKSKNREKNIISIIFLTLLFITTLFSFFIFINVLFLKNKGYDRVFTTYNFPMLLALFLTLYLQTQ